MRVGLWHRLRGALKFAAVIQGCRGTKKRHRLATFCEPFGFGTPTSFLASLEFIFTRSDGPITNVAENLMGRGRSARYVTQYAGVNTRAGLQLTMYA
jgi:hypothetical protein